MSVTGAFFLTFPVTQISNPNFILITSSPLVVVIVVVVVVVVIVGGGGGGGGGGIGVVLPNQATS